MSQLNPATPPTLPLMLELLATKLQGAGECVNRLINQTPSGNVRNELTSINIYLLAAIKRLEAAKKQMVLTKS